MAGVRISESDQTPAAEPPRTGGLIESLIHFDGPPDRFLKDLLRAQCQVSSAEAGAIFRAAEGGKTEVLAVFPPPAEGGQPPPWVGQALQQAPEVFASGQAATQPLHDASDLYGQPARRQLVVVPLRSEAGPGGVAAFVMPTADSHALADARQRLELSGALLNVYEMRLTLQRRQLDFRRLRSALEILASVNEHDRFAAAAMAYCNEVASRHQCDRAALGFRKGRYVALKALSHTEKFSRKMKLVQDIEAAMEECYDQDLEIVHPPPEESSFVGRAARELSVRHGPTSVLSLPLRREGEVLGVATLERPIDRPFGPQEIETLRLTCELSTPRLANLHEQDRWFGAKAARAVRKLFAAALGPKHTWIKLLSLLILGFVVFVTFARGTYRAEAPFVFQAIEQRVLPAPFDGYIDRVEVAPGDPVRRGQLLATLETDDLRLKLTEAQAEQRRYLTEAKAAREARETAKMQIAEAQASEVAARIHRLERQIEQSRICAPIAGYVVRGDLEGRIGAPVKTGEVLFEVAPLTPVLADVRLDEALLADLKDDPKGELRPPGAPDRSIRFVLEQTPAAQGGERDDGGSAGGPATQADRPPNARLRLAKPMDWVEPGAGGEVEIVLSGRARGKVKAVPVPVVRAELSVPQAKAQTLKPGMSGELTVGGKKVPLAVARLSRPPADAPADQPVAVSIHVFCAADALPDEPAFEADVVIAGTSLAALEVRREAALRAELSVPEDLIADVREGMIGELAAAAYPDRHIGFVVERINPVAEVVEQENVFKIRVRLEKTADWMRPGMEGLGKIDIDRRSYGAIWTRRLVNWIRMKLWL